MVKHTQIFFKAQFVLIIILCSIVNVTGFSQTIFWTENFSPGWPNGVWTYNTSTGANSASCNWWYVSCQDDGYPAGGCGTACITGDPSLHVGSQTLGDVGAAYDASQTTNRRTESPNINTSVAGANTITLSFTYIQYGQAGVDCCQLFYSINGGTSWNLLANPIPQAPCCSGACDGQLQGLWTARSYALPASCNNIANLKIAFNWINNNTTGSDPSFAVDNITLQYNAPVPVTWLYFEGFYVNNATKLIWKTASETNNDYFEIQRSLDGLNYSYIGKVKGSGNSNEIKSYTFFDNYSNPMILYYRLKQVDIDGTAVYSRTIAVNNAEISDGKFSVKTDLVSNSCIVTIYTNGKNPCYLEINDVIGKKLINQYIDLQDGNSFFQINVSAFNPGIYYLVLKDRNNQKVIAFDKFIKM
jgi:hypothetical protein